MTRTAGTLARHALWVAAVLLVLGIVPLAAATSLPPASTPGYLPPTTKPTEPPPTITLPNPPPRMAPDRLPDLRDLDPAGRLAVPTDTRVTPPRLVTNRLENRLSTPRGPDPAPPPAATANRKPQARDLLASAKPIL